MNKNIKAYLGYTFVLSWILLGIAAIGRINQQTPLGILLTIPAGLAPGTFGILLLLYYPLHFYFCRLFCLEELRSYPYIWQ